MSHKVSYTNLTPRTAVLDLVKYIGFKKSLIIIRSAPLMSIDKFEFLCSLAGVSGFPIIKAYERWKGGSERVEIKECKEKSGSKRMKK